MAVILLAVAGVWGVPRLVRSLSYESTDDAFVEADVVAISPKVAGHVLRVHVRSNREVTTGTLLVEIDARDFEAALEKERAALGAAEANAEAARVNVESARATSTGDVDQANAGVTSAGSLMSVSKAGTELMKTGAEQAKAQLDAAMAEEKRAKSDADSAAAEVKRTGTELERLRELVDEGAVSRQEFDVANFADQGARARLEAAQKSMQAAEAQVANARGALEGALQRVGLTELLLQYSAAGLGQAQGRLTSAQAGPHRVEAAEADYKQARARVEQARAAVREAELDLSYTRICAPQPGKVTRKSVEEGAYVQVGQPLMAIVTPGPWVVANFKETQITHMRPGQGAWVRVDAFPGEEFRGHVDSIQAGSGARFSLLPPENATGNFVKVVQRVPVKIVFDEPPETLARLAPGMSARPEVRVK